jgi:two-component system, OmpR family, sensor histidine kinase MtrB
MKHQLHRSSIDIEAASGTIETLTDPALLSRAVELLLDNAAKYGGRPSTIKVEFGKDDFGYIRIRDNGGGIAEDKLESIFSKYARLEESGATRNTTAGLGLTIARAIMRILGGDIVATNHPDGGAVFTLSFPVT